MRRGTIIMLAIVGVLGLTGLSCVAGAFSYRSSCLNYEADIKAQWEQNQNSYDQMWKTIKEMAQVPAMYTEDLKKAFDGAIRARYGSDGSHAMFQVIQEHNPNFDNRLYVRIQEAIESGRTRFANDQRDLVSRKNVYARHRNSTSALVYNGFFHFPRIQLSKYEVVTSGETSDAFRTHRAPELKLR